MQDLNIATEPTKQLPPQFRLCVLHANTILPFFVNKDVVVTNDRC
jgi:hypothetical protein